MNYPEDFIGKIIHGDCLEIMKDIPDQSIDMILADLPYGTTACKWDSIIPLEPLWEQYNRIIKNRGAIVLTSSQPFTTTLISSNISSFKYEWVWEKTTPSNIALADKQPLKYHENVCVFYNKQSIYNKQLIKRDELGKKRLKNKNNPIRFVGNQQQGSNKRRDYDINKYNEEYKNPSSVIKIKIERGKLHPTQKPIALFEYMIKTYTHENALVLDNVIGSGTTAVACINTNRRFIGIEKEKKYVDIARQRILEASNE